jgi:hypothetical protein
MKKNTLIFILFLGNLNFSIAQESSPTKEVTVQSINKYMNEAVGMKTYDYREDNNGNYTIRNGENTIEVNTFSLDKIDRSTAMEDYDREGNYRGTYTSQWHYSQLNWDNFTIAIDSSESLWRESNLAVIKIYPKSKVKCDHYCVPGTYIVDCTQTEYREVLEICIPKNRVTSCHKAFLHLKELMKEDDPFGN